MFSRALRCLQQYVTLRMKVYGIDDLEEDEDEDEFGDEEDEDSGDYEEDEGGDSEEGEEDEW